MFFNDLLRCRRSKSAVSADFCGFPTPRKQNWVLKDRLLHYCSGSFGVCSREPKFPAKDEASVRIIPDGKRFRCDFPVGCSAELPEPSWETLGTLGNAGKRWENACTA